MNPTTNRLTKLDYATWGAFMIFAVSSIIVAVSLPEISATFSTSLSEGGGLETARTLVLFAVLILAGLLAQRWGKQRFLALGQYLLAAGLLLGSFAQSYAALLVAVMLTGIGGGFSEALLNPLLVDMHPRDSGKYLNISHAFYPLGIVVAALFFGELLTLGYSWRLLFQIAAAGALAVAALFTVLPFPAGEQAQGSYLGQFAAILGRGGFWLFAVAIALGGAAESAFTFWSRTYVGTYLSDVPRAGAIAVGLFAGAMTLGRFLTASLANRFSLNTIMLASALLGLGVSLLIPQATALSWFYFFLALAGLAVACFWPTLLAEADAYLPVNTTILFVALACAGILGYGLSPWLMGVIGDMTNLRNGFLVIPALFGLLIGVLLWQRRLAARHGMAPDKRPSSLPAD